MKKLGIMIFGGFNLIAIAILLVGALAIFGTHSTFAMAGDKDNHAISVPSGDVAALYAAVYDENGQPRNNATITLEAGTFLLDPLQPFDGRLVLGEKTVLKSTLEMEKDINGIPLVDENDRPIIVIEGAKIDGRELTDAFWGEGIIAVGDHGMVTQLWIDGGAIPGIEITHRGTIKGVVSTNHSFGMRIRAAEIEANGKIEGSLVANNSLNGIAVVALDPDLEHPNGENVEVQATIDRNRIINNGNMNLFIHAGLGTDKSEVRTNASHNVFRGAAGPANIRVIGGFDLQAHGGAHNNVVKASFNDNLIANGEVGLMVEGSLINSGFLSDPSLSLEERQSSNNSAEVVLSQNTFENNSASDIALSGSRSHSDELGGGDNSAKVNIAGSTAGLNIEAFDCFPIEAFPTCSSEAEVNTAQYISTNWRAPITLQPHDGAVTKLAFSPDNQWLATGGEDGKTHLWRLNQQATYQADFVRLAPDASDPTGHNAKEHCGGDFQDATANISIQQEGDSSTVQIMVSNARPETLFTTWLRVKGKTQGAEGVEYGGSPLTGAGSTPLAASSAVEELAAITDTPGSTEVANGLWTNASGEGELIAELDFPLLGGAYPFHQYDDSLAPLAIVGAPFAPFMIRIASHCTDEIGHGLKAGNREPWFDWSP